MQSLGTASPGVTEPLYDKNRRSTQLEEDEEMEIIVTKIQEDTAYRSSSRLVRIIQVVCCKCPVPRDTRV